MTAEAIPPTRPAATGTMRALLSVAPGDALSLELGVLPRGEPGAGEVLIKTHYAGVNFPDALIIQDRYQIRPERPFSPGIEVSGVVASIGEGVTNFTVGQRVAALLRYGGMADYAIAPVITVAPVPDAVDLPAACSLIVSHGTSWHALHDRAKLRAGETLLVLGASGVVGLAAVQLGKAIGATVIAAVSTEEKAALARRAGADQVVVYASDAADVRAVATEFKAACGVVGADCVFDPVGGAYGEAALRTLAWQGRYLIVGFAAAAPNLAPGIALLKSADLLGVTWGETVSRTPGMFARHLAEIAELLASRGLTPPEPRIVALNQASDAIEAMATRRALGKTLVRLGDR